MSGLHLRSDQDQVKKLKIQPRTGSEFNSSAGTSGSLMHPLKEQYYRSRYLATVRFIDSHSFTIEGGMPEKRALEAAKKEATFCYVKDITTKSEAKLELLNGQWVLSKG